MKESRKKLLKQICAWVLALVALASSIPLDGVDGLFADVDDVMEDVIGGSTETTVEEKNLKVDITENKEVTKETKGESAEVTPEPVVANVDYEEPETEVSNTGSVFLSLTEGGSVDVYIVYS